jgi:hypothetical protein
MVAEPKTVEIDNLPDVLKLAEEVQRTNEPRILRRNGEEIARLVPVRRSRRRYRPKSPEDIAASLATAGAWKDVDTDQLIKDIYEGRRIGMDRPAPEL